MNQRQKEEKKPHLSSFQIYQYFKTENTSLIDPIKKIPYTMVPDKEDIELLLLLEKNIREEKSQHQAPMDLSSKQKTSYSSLQESKRVKQFYIDFASLTYSEQLKAFQKKPFEFKERFSYRLQNIPSNEELHRYAPLPGLHRFQAGFLKYLKYQFESAIQDLIPIAELYPTACLLLGMSYNFLDNKAKSAIYFKKAIENKEWIFNRLNFEDGSSWFFAGFYLDKIEHDPRAALFYNKAVKLHFSTAQAIVGLIYYNNHQRDKAFTLFQHSAKQADPIGQTYLAISYSKYDPTQEKKIHWLTKAANQGSALAQTQLALHYLQLKPPNLKSAVRLLKKAIVHKTPEALYLFGMMNLDGIGVDQDIALGVKYLTQSADANFPKAHYMLGILIYEGIQLEHNANLARDHLEKAAASGLVIAIKKLAEFFPPEESSAAHSYSKR